MKLVLDKIGTYYCSAGIYLPNILHNSTEFICLFEYTRVKELEDITTTFVTTPLLEPSHLIHMSNVEWQTISFIILQSIILIKNALVSYNASEPRPK